MKKLVALLLVGALVVLSVGCASPKPEAEQAPPAAEELTREPVAAPAEEPPAPAEPEKPDVAGTLVNPLVEVGGSSDIEAALGVGLVIVDVPKTGFTATDVHWYTIGGIIGEVDFYAKTMNGIMPMGESQATVRVMPSAQLEDISGVATVYDETVKESFTNSHGTAIEVEIRATQDVGAVAVWYNPDTQASYSASFTEFSTDYMTTAAVMKYLLQEVIALN